MAAGRRRGETAKWGGGGGDVRNTEKTKHTVDKRNWSYIRNPQCRYTYRIATRYTRRACVS